MSGVGGNFGGDPITKRVHLAAPNIVLTPKQEAVKDAVCARTYAFIQQLTGEITMSGITYDVGRLTAAIDGIIVARNQALDSIILGGFNHGALPAPSTTTAHGK